MKLKSGPFKGMEVVISDQDVVDQHEDIVDEILDCIGVRAALVTDRSALSDFDRDDSVARVNEHFGLQLTTAQIEFPVLIGLILKARAPRVQQ